MSIQGVQPKLSAILKIKEGCFDIVDRYGKYILKPQCDYPELPQNEALTMSLAEMAGIEVPIHGLLYSKDGSLTYFIKRFDRAGKKDKLPIEDFAQLAGKSRETKYASSMENVAKIIKKYCTFPSVEFVKLFRLSIFSFLIGNEDMHLKNFSVITHGNKTQLSPAYDLVNSTIALSSPVEEFALPINGKKSNLTRGDFVDYFAIKFLGLATGVVDDILAEFHSATPGLKKLISNSLLSGNMKKKYLKLLMERSLRLDFPPPVTPLKMEINKNQ